MTSRSPAYWWWAGFIYGAVAMGIVMGVAMLTLLGVIQA